jgi:MFS transporter, putative metabolite:H+ symporter
MNKRSLFSGWGQLVAFWGGSVIVAIGVALHLPMFWMGRMTGFRLVGMPMGAGMFVGMALIVLGVLAAAYGLLPSGGKERASSGSVVPPEDAPLTKEVLQLLIW